MILAYFAMSFAMTVEKYIEQNLWVQYVIACVLVTVGLALFFRRASGSRHPMMRKNNGFIKGLLLAVLNPPVLVFWLVAFAFISTNTPLDLHMGMAGWILLFFAGVFVGKIFTLWLYLQLSKRIARQAGHLTEQINKGIGLVVFALGCLQLVNLLM